MSMNATTVKMPRTANESAARAVSPPKAYAQAQEQTPPSTSSQKSLAGMRAPQPRQRPPCTRKLRHGTSSAADSVRPHAGQ